VENQKTIIEISCIEVWREVSAYLDNDIDEELRARLEFHFQHCKHCTAVLEGTRNTICLIGDEQAFEIPSGFGERLVANLNKRIHESGT
jgi:hypothetical protein